MSYIDSEDYANEMMRESDEDFENFLKLRPKCQYCEEIIMDDRGFWDGTLDGWWHKNCILDYIRREISDEYIADAIIELVKDELPEEEIEEYYR